MILAGCTLTVEVGVDVQPDGSGTVTVVATADAELLEQAPGALSDLRLDDIRAAGWTVTGPDDAPEGGAALTLTKPFADPAAANRVLAEINGPAGPLHDITVTLDRSFARTRYGFTGTARLDGGIEALSDADLTAALGQVPFQDQMTVPLDQALRLVVRARLPGELTSSNGEVVAGEAGAAGQVEAPEPTQAAAEEVRWEPDLAGGAITDLRAASEIRDREAERARLVQRVALALLAIVAGALVVGGGVWLVQRRRHRRR